MVLIIMCDLKSFDDASQGQKPEVARLVEPL
jgi:hypothetical protein